jgi:methylthioribose-1-phosphate isomerase
LLPLSFEIPATNLKEACDRFADAAKVAFDETLKELQEMRRQQASSIVIPDAGAAAAIGQAGLPPRGKIQIP